MTESGNDAARWRTVMVVAASIAAIITLITPATAVAWLVADMRREQSVALAQFQTTVSQQISALEKSQAEAMRSLEIRQDAKFVDKDYFSRELNHLRELLTAEGVVRDGPSDR